MGHVDNLPSKDEIVTEKIEGIASLVNTGVVSLADRLKKASQINHAVLKDENDEEL